MSSLYDFQFAQLIDTLSTRYVVTDVRYNSGNGVVGIGGSKRVCAHKNKCDEIYACKQSVRNKNNEQKCKMYCQLVIALKKL